jgi:hypothetical protein
MKACIMMADLQNAADQVMKVLMLMNCNDHWSWIENELRFGNLLKTFQKYTFPHYLAGGGGECKKPITIGVPDVIKVLILEKGQSIVTVISIILQLFCRNLRVILAVIIFGHSVVTSSKLGLRHVTSSL